MRFDYVVIGSGVAGLTAAAYLSGRGFSVAVLEKAPRPGPTLAGFVREGLRFDTGLHLTGGLADGEILHSYLRMLGVEKDLERVFFDKNAAERIVFTDDVAHIPALDLPTGFDSFRAALHTRFPASTAAVDDYIKSVRAAVDASAFLNPGQATPVDSIEAGVAFNDTSLQSVLDGLTQDPCLRMVLALRTSLHGAPPHEALFRNHALVDGSLRESLGTFSGGGYSLIKALVRKIRANGGVIRLGCGATKILCHDGSVTGVRDETGEELQTRHCIYTGHPALLPDLVPPEAFRGIYVRRLQSLPETSSCCMLFAVVDDPPAELTGRGLYLCPSLDPCVLLGNDDPQRNLIFLSLLPEGKNRNRAALSAVMPCSAQLFEPWADSRRETRPAIYQQVKSALIQRMKHRIIFALPSLKGRLRVVDGATPLTLADYTHNPRGGTDGVRQTVNELPLLPRTRVAGLFLAGQSVLLPGLLGSMVSAFVACGLSTDWGTLQKELNQWHAHE